MTYKVLIMKAISIVPYIRANVAGTLTLTG